VEIGSENLEGGSTASFIIIEPFVGTPSREVDSLCIDLLVLWGIGQSEISGHFVQPGVDKQPATFSRAQLGFGYFASRHWRWSRWVTRRFWDGMFLENLDWF
jgi:hypothetical protein